MKSQGIIKVIRIHHLGTMNVGTTICANSSVTCQAIKPHGWKLGLEERSGDHQHVMIFSYSGVTSLLRNTVLIDRDNPQNTYIVPSKNSTMEWKKYCPWHYEGHWSANNHTMQCVAFYRCKNYGPATLDLSMMITRMMIHTVSIQNVLTIESIIEYLLYRRWFRTQSSSYMLLLNL